MFGKITKQQVAHSFHKAKNFIGHAYNQTKGLLNHVDHGVQTFKQIYNVASPSFFPAGFIDFCHEPRSVTAVNSHARKRGPT